MNESTHHRANLRDALPFTFLITFAVLLALSLSSCGGGDHNTLPSDAAARVGNTVVPQTLLQQHVRAAKRLLAQGSTRSPALEAAFTRHSILSELIREEWARQESIHLGLRIPTNLTRNIQQSLVMQKLLAYVTDNRGHVSAATVRAYFDRHRNQYKTPEGRQIQLLSASTRAQAEHALASLQQGAEWPDVIRQFGNPNQFTLDNHGLLTVLKHQLPRELDLAVFRAVTGTLYGPIRVRDGWYVVRVALVAPASPPRLRNWKESIRAKLETETKDTIFTRWLKNLGRKYREQTLCNDQLVVPECTST